MGKRKKKKENPIMQEKYEKGKSDGVMRATRYFFERFEDLKKEPGIGPKTLEKVRRIFFEHYKREKGNPNE